MRGGAGSTSPGSSGGSPPRLSPSPNGRGRTLRIGVRMPDGRRAVRFFGEGDALISLFAFVDSLFIPVQFSSEADPPSPPTPLPPTTDANASGETLVLAEIARLHQTAPEWWGFKLWLQYPRREVAFESGKRIGDVEVLRGGGQLVVEVYPDAGVVAASKKGKAAAGNEGDSEEDGYETESD